MFTWPHTYIECKRKTIMRRLWREPSWNRAYFMCRGSGSILGTTETGHGGFVIPPPRRQRNQKSYVRLGFKGRRGGEGERKGERRGRCTEEKSGVCLHCRYTAGEAPWAKVLSTGGSLF